MNSWKGMTFLLAGLCAINWVDANGEVVSRGKPVFPTKAEAEELAALEKAAHPELTLTAQIKCQ